MSHISLIYNSQELFPCFYLKFKFFSSYHHCNQARAHKCTRSPSPPPPTACQGKLKSTTLMSRFRRDSRWTPMDYASWAANHPSTYTSAALWRDSVTNKTQWIGVWAGSENQLPAFTFPFICERRALRKYVFQTFCYFLI